MVKFLISQHFFSGWVLTTQSKKHFGSFFYAAASAAQNILFDSKQYFPFLFVCPRPPPPWVTFMNVLITVNKCHPQFV